MDYEKLSQVMRDLALQSGKAIMEIYNSESVSFETKADNSPVTIADQAADRIIFAGLKQAFPALPVVTEEQASSQTKQHDTFLIVDPLDGTKEFIKKTAEFTVNIALIENGVPTRGIVYAPAIERLFYTDAKGQPVEEQAPFEEKALGRVSPISVKSPDNEALIVVASKSHRDQDTDAYISKYSVAKSTSAGSSLKFCLLAAGEADFYPRLGRTMEWDTAAGHAILSAAGGAVVQFNTLSPLEYGKFNYENPHFIALVEGVNLKS
ncbi:MAG: 3'(2'),5'-bisphosphate nucleotidase CysQ [Paracoccaceae bacterium]